MKYCDDYAALLDLFIDGELSPAEMADVQAHLDTCPGCRAYVDDALALRAAFPDLEDTAVPQGFAEGVMAAVRAQAAPRKRQLSKLLLPLAACCAVVLLVRGVGLGGGKFGAASTAADTSAPMATQALTEEPAAAQSDSAAESGDDSTDTCLTAYGAERYNAAGTPKAVSPYFAILTLPADALELESLAADTPVSEADGERRYELSAGDYAVLLDQLDAAGIQPIVREQTGSESETALVIVTDP